MKDDYEKGQGISVCFGFYKSGFLSFYLFFF